MEEFITYLLQNIITSEDISIQKAEDPYMLTYTLTIPSEEIGKVIGKKGKTINAIRNLCTLYLHKHFPDETRKIIVKVEEA